MTDTPEPKRAYQMDAVSRAADITIEKILRDVQLRKWAVETAKASGMDHEAIYKFVTQSSVEFLEGLGYVVKSSDESPASS